MGAKKKKFSGKQDSSSNNQQTSQEHAKELLEKEKKKKEAELMKDERVKEKIEEYEKKIKEAEEKLRNDEQKLKEKYDLLNEELESSQKTIDEYKLQIEEKIKELAEVEKTKKQEIENARKEEIEKVKADERSIREKEKTELFAKWEEEKDKKQIEFEMYIAARQKKIDNELEKAHAIRVEAEESKLAKIHEADLQIEEKSARLTAEYQEKMVELAKLRAKCKAELEEITEEKAELDEDRKYLKDRKEKYSQFSELEVLKLKQQLSHYEQIIQANMEHIKELSSKNARLESFMLDDNGASLNKKLKELEEQLIEARKKNDELANMPSVEEIDRLRANTQELENLRTILEDERQRRETAESKMSSYAMGMRELENARVSAAALESLNNQLQMKLKYISEQYKSTQESKFKVLLDIDKEVNNQGIFRAKGFGGNLAELVDYIREYGAYKKGLYYSTDIIRVFLSSLAASEPASRLLILQGLSGTGKSSLPKLVADALSVECRLVPVQPSWRDSRELLGYDNDFTNRFKETEFTKYLYEATALQNQNKIYFIVLDEMNLARVEYYFADFLSVLEKSDQEWLIPLVSGYSETDDEQKPKYLNYDNEAANLCVTKNIWFVGTANNDDSTSLITDKVYDRAQILDMDEREEAFKGKSVAQVSMDLEELLMLFREAKTTDNKLTESDWDKIRIIDDYLKELDITFGNRIKKQMEDFIPVYIACGGTKEGAIDYLLTHKILRKLDERYEPYLVSKLEDLEIALNDIYKEGVFKQSIEKIHKLREKIAG